MHLDGISFQSRFRAAVLPAGKSSVLDSAPDVPNLIKRAITEEVQVYCVGIRPWLQAPLTHGWHPLAQGPFPSSNTGSASAGGAQKPANLLVLSAELLVAPGLSAPASSHLHTHFLMWERLRSPWKGAEPHPTHLYAWPASLPGCVPMAQLPGNSHPSAAGHDLEDALGTFPGQSSPAAPVRFVCSPVPGQGAECSTDEGAWNASGTTGRHIGLSNSWRCSHTSSPCSSLHEGLASVQAAPWLWGHSGTHIIALQCPEHNLMPVTAQLALEIWAQGRSRVWEALCCPRLPPTGTHTSSVVGAPSLTLSLPLPSRGVVWISSWIALMWGGTC